MAGDGLAAAWPPGRVHRHFHILWISRCASASMALALSSPASVTRYRRTWAKICPARLACSRTVDRTAAAPDGFGLAARLAVDALRPWPCGRVWRLFGARPMRLFI